ncbi:hypothetical protein BBI01_17985 [Chryseobacterium artocarpi]|uniref:Uncharacterized protein n=1 Tax=Chryseobacterium artocarpi TaxID=1414727 RepID=A0A1B8ZBX7_9FLAO|nr:hypothetical protein [Chryseobacterium artocarpi]OCA69100.1 hypothetical protein BBI01_17985 [Chryseobacterium artocarpi]
MKALKIYSIISTIAVLILSVSLYNTTKNYNKTQNEFDKTKKEYKETEEVLQQCSDRYYKAIGK